MGGQTIISHTILLLIFTHSPDGIIVEWVLYSSCFILLVRQMVCFVTVFARKITCLEAALCVQVSPNI